MRWIAGVRALNKQPAGFRGFLRRRSRRSITWILCYFYSVFGGDLCNAISSHKLPPGAFGVGLEVAEFLHEFACAGAGEGIVALGALAV